MKEKSHLIFVRTKGGIAENFGRIQKGRPQICLEDEFMGRGGGGDRESHQKFFGVSG